MKDTAEILSHEQASALLPWLINGSLSENEKDTLMEHANSCLDCRREAKQLKALQAALSRESALSSVPPPNVPRVMKRIEEYEDRRTFNPVARLMDYCASSSISFEENVRSVLSVYTPLADGPETTSRSKVAMNCIRSDSEIPGLNTVLI